MQQSGRQSGKVAAIVLAAGMSRRMGCVKALLPWSGRPMIAAVVDALHAAGGIDPIIVVTGHEAPSVAAAVAKAGVTLAHNPNYERGEMLSSVQTGLRSLPPDTTAFLVSLGDQPIIAPATIRLIIETWRSQPASIVIPTFRARRGHPILLPISYAPQILALTGPQTLRTLVADHLPESVQLPVEDPAILTDIDTPEDYQRAMRRWATGTGGAADETKKR